VQSFKIITSLFILIIITSTLHAQKIEWFKNSSNPAMPNGGEKELKDFVKTEFIYPKQALENRITGDVFITYKVNNNGKVINRVADSLGNYLLIKEALRVFDKIIWEPNQDRNPTAFEGDQLKFIFNPKAYKRLVKKRAYDAHPKTEHKQTDDTNYYTINQLDEKPSITNAKSINAFISANFSYPSIALQREISGRVTVEFIIEPYGLATNVKVIEAVSGGCSEETVRLVKAMKWKPGIRNNEAVRTLFNYQLNFVHPGSSIR
tara:strand:+ start:1501 stop:2289 length:789 start_codon:yes stop_codon:yes gene_type:complete